MKLKKLLFPLVTGCILAGSAIAQTTLSVGDLAFTGLNTEDEAFTFVVLVDIQAGTEIYFSDEEPTGSTLNNGAMGEGVVKYTAPGAVSAGTIITYSSTTGLGSSINATNFTLEQGTFFLSNGGEGIVAFQGYVPGTTTVTTFLNQIGEDSGDIGTPTGLTAADQIVLGADDGEFTGTRSGTKSGLYSDIDDVATNWTTTASNGGTTLSTTAFTIAAATTTWNGATWSDGVPSATIDAVIASSTSPGTFSCKKLTINSGFSLRVNNGTTATIGGNITNNGSGFAGTGTVALNDAGSGVVIELLGNAISFGGEININTGTSLQTNSKLTLTAASASSYGTITGGGSVTDNMSMQAFLDLAGGGNDGRYYYLGSPFTSATLSDFNESGSIMVSSNTQQGTAWEWDAANAEWDPAGAGNLANTATNGQGYAIYAGTNSFGTFLRSGAGTITLSGSPTSNDVARGLFYNNGQGASLTFVGGTGVSATQGWNLLANPFPAVYDWDLQTIPTDMSSAYYTYNGSNYSSYTKGAGTSSRYIAPFRAFFLQLTANNPGNITFDSDNRVSGQSPALGKRAASYTIDGIYLHIEGQNGSVYDDVFVGYEANATSAFDNAWDARKLINRAGTPNLFVQLGSTAYSLCRVPYNGPRSFPLKLRYDQDNDPMTIELDRDELQSFGQVTLEDRKLNLIHDLTLSDYNFTHDAAYGEDRFILHFGQPSIGIEEPETKAMVFGYASEDGIYVDLGILHHATVEVFNLAGQKVQETSNAEGTLLLPVHREGIYLVRVSTADFNQTIKVIR